MRESSVATGAPGTLEPLLAALLPVLPSPLLSPGATRALRHAASALPPVLRGGFEVRLGGASPWVDLQQCVLPTGEEAARLRAFLDARYAAPGAHPAWRRLRSLLAALERPPLREGVSELWLEVDSRPLDPARPAPSIFFGMWPDGLSHAARETIIHSTLETLRGGPLSPAVAGTLARCLRACEASTMGHPRHAGMMLSREGGALRLNVRGLSPESATPFLRAAGWPGEARALCRLMEWAASHVERITLCLEIGREVSPRIGLECFLEGQPGGEPRWEGWLGALVARGLCTPVWRDALLAWPGVSHPGGGIPWPEDLLVESLFRPATCFTLLARRLNHIKLLYHPGEPPRAKGYLWFDHRWLEARAATGENHREG